MSSPQTREAKLADDYLTSATLAREVAHRALEHTMRSLNDGSMPSAKAADAAVKAATASGIMLDKRLILEGRPTQIHAAEDPIQAGMALLKRHGITIDSTATDLEPAPQLETSVQTETRTPVQTNPQNTSPARESAPKPRAAE